MFNVRVYGIVRNESDEVLLTDEFRMGMRMTKFPGGGLQFGEGLHDALIREFREEMDLEAKVTGHYYTTDFFQASAFRDNEQLISIYYLADLENIATLETSRKPFDFVHETDGAQAFRWVPRQDLHEAALTFPIDQWVASRLRAGWQL
ncbi:MAG: NUDIX hydrolase [Flavobacteriales bacterium]|nr:NUDIX hydrolase [Flavobacteriales bacterium]